MYPRLRANITLPDDSTITIDRMYIDEPDALSAAVADYAQYAAYSVLGGSGRVTLEMCGHLCSQACEKVEGCPDVEWGEV